MLPTPPDVITDDLAPGPFLLSVRPRNRPTSLVAWLSTHREFVLSRLVSHGAVLLRDFEVDGAVDFERASSVIAPVALAYEGGTAPRKRIAPGVMSSTEAPATQVIPQHTEMSYLERWPLKLLLYCVQPSETGGETPLCSLRRLRERHGERLHRLFEDRGVMYVRNYLGFFTSWKAAFETTEPANVETFLRANAFTWEWLDGGSLRTRNVAQGLARHPSTGESVFFNQAYGLNRWYLKRTLSPAICARLGDDNLPSDTFYGDGTPIEESVLAELYGIDEEEKVRIPWQAGDVIIVDNMLATHGRMPFTGPRSVLVSLREPSRA